MVCIEINVVKKQLFAFLYNLASKAHEETIVNIDGPRYWQNTGGRTDMFEAVQRYLGPSWEVTAIEHHGD